jgi:hypothetical protein
MAGVALGWQIISRRRRGPRVRRTNDAATSQNATAETTPTGPPADQPGKYRYDDSFQKAAWAAVPEIGATWSRWYDPPYRFLSWWLSSWPTKTTPRRLHDRLRRWHITLVRYNEHDRNKARSLDDPMHNIFVPDDEHVSVPSLWVIELFPPSAAAELTSLVRKYKPSVQLFPEDDESLSILSQTRAGQGYDWFTVAFIQHRKPQRLVPDSRTEQLPELFWGIKLTSIQLGTGLTAVVAQFHLTKDCAASLDREWHQRHEPQLRKRGKHLIAEDRQWSAFSHTQKVRRQPHDSAREWMAQNCPGLFAQSFEPQPLMDLLIVENHNPTSRRRSELRKDDALRALGLTETHNLIVSPTVVPQLALVSTDPDMCPTLGTRRTWALWGNGAAAVEARPNLTKYVGLDEYESLAHTADDETRDIFLALSVTEMVKLMQQQYTTLRDTARRQHDSFSSRYLGHLRQTLLTLSVDLASAKVDVPSWWERHRSSIPPFYVVDPAYDDDEPVELTERLRTRQTDDLAALSDADATIRGILSTVTSLGAASDTYKISRIALYVAALSLVVAMVTLVFTSIGPESVAAHLVTLLKHLWIRLAH